MQYVASISYGKDSLAMLEAIKLLGYPLDRIITAEVWATDTIPADLPPMQDFKANADKIILDRYGISVEHFCALDKNGEKMTYEKLFYHIPKRKNGGVPVRIPEVRKQMCSELTTQDVCDTKTQYLDFQYERELGVSANSRRMPYGFPVSINRGNWCTRLKTKCFLIPPLHKAEMKILCSISALQQMNLKELKGTKTSQM